MMKVFVALLVLSVCSLGKANEYITDNLICTVAYHKAISCVSKASIEKDKVELELIKLQAELIKSQLEKTKLEKPKLKK